MEFLDFVRLVKAQIVGCCGAGLGSMSLKVETGRMDGVRRVGGGGR